jgi:hypothetical protein
VSPRKIRRETYTQPEPKRDVWHTTYDGVVLHTPHLCISVHHHRDDPTTWLVTCYELLVTQHELASVALEQAKNEAIKIVKARVTMLADELEKL